MPEILLFLNKNGKDIAPYLEDMLKKENLETLGRMAKLKRLILITALRDKSLYSEQLDMIKSSILSNISE